MCGDDGTCESVRGEGGARGGADLLEVDLRLLKGQHALAEEALQLLQLHDRRRAWRGRALRPLQRLHYRRYR